MRNRHNKKRNTAFVYEALLREETVFYVATWNVINLFIVNKVSIVRPLKELSEKPR